MSSAKRLSKRERSDQGAAFLNYLETRDILRTSSTKDILRQAFNEQFKTLWRNEHGGPIANFSSNLFQLKKEGKIRTNRSGEVSFCQGKIKRKTVRSSNSPPSQAAATDQSSPKQTSPKRQISISVDQHIVARDSESSDEHDSTSNGSTSALPRAAAAEGGLPDGVKKSGGFYVCEMCRVMVHSKKEVQLHLDGKKHRVQKLVHGLKANSAALTINRANIEVIATNDGPQSTVLLDGPQGSVRMDIEEGKVECIVFTITNKGKEAVTLVACELLRKLRLFQIDDPKQVCDGIGTADIKPGTSYQVNMTVGPANIGRFHRPIAFAFTKKGTKDQYFPIVRYVSVRCRSSAVDELLPKSPFKQPPRAAKIAPPSEVLDGVRCSSGATENHLELSIPVENHYIEISLRNVMKHGIKPWHDMSDSDKQMLAKVKSLLHNDLSFENYHTRLSLLLHIEELQMEVDIRKYDMDNVTMSKHNNKLLELQVPGLAENRPSVLKGDALYVRILADGKPGNQEYKGYVHEVRCESVYLGFHNILMDKYLPNMKFKVRFTFNRLPLKLQHRATQLSEEHSLDKILFPNQTTICTQGVIQPVDTRLRLKNRLLENNKEQLNAVQHILAGTSRPAPYLVFGPPGTGKTVTMVEAMKQVLYCIPGSHILACAPSNSAADLLTSRLLQHVDKKDIIRLNASSRPWSSVEEAVKPCCKYNATQNYYIFPKKNEMMTYRVVVCTLVTAGRICSANFPPGHFTHIFIDEAGHAVEPEGIIAIAGILESDINLKHGGQVVLAGDPKQLGPVLRSPVAMKHGLDISLLERFMQLEVFSRGANNQYDQRVLTKLLCNYRSHPDILHIPNSSFYHGELKTCADELERSSLCHWEGLAKKGFPMVFHGVIGQDMREERSPSFFNPEEVVLVERYVKQLLEARGGGINVKEEHIGIITPYRKQVQKIRQQCNKKRWTKIKVGSVEEFQGQERRVIIISTVRSNTDYLPMDKEYKLGFVSNPKRFNVAVTRAKALIIVIGNPNLLCRDENWNKLLSQCIDKGAYVGCDFDKPEDQYEDMMERFKAVGLSEISEVLSTGLDLDSNVQEQVEPEWRGEN